MVLLLLPAALAWPYFNAEWRFGPAIALLPLTFTFVVGAREAIDALEMEST